MVATGLAMDKVAQQYARAVSKSKASWATLDESGRAEALLAPANAALGTLGVPTVKPLIDPFGNMVGTANRANFNPGTWTVWFSPDLLVPLLDDQDFGRRANTTYHEVRHAEQTFRVARKLAADGKDANAIAQSISIPADKAAKAVANPLSAKQKDEWAEANDWLFNMQVDPDGTSRAEIVNAAHAQSMTKYNQVRMLWRNMQRARDNEPNADPAIKQMFDERRKTPGGSKSLDELLASWQSQYNDARERARQCYLMYAKMPLEQDAWATGGLVEKHLKLTPTTAEQELANLDRDERVMIPVQVSALARGSDLEKALVAAISKNL